MLSQNEIDALLSGAIEIEETDQDSVNLASLIGQKKKETEDSGERQIRPYNFWSPDRFSKDQMRAVELVHEELGERLTNSLPSFLHTNLRPRLVHTEQGRFHDFLGDLSPNSLLNMVTLAPLPGQMVITISPEISFIILEQRLGGRSDRRADQHTLTEIDQSLLQDLVESMLNDIKAAWSKVVPVEPKRVDSTVNHHWVQMLVGNERVMTVVFELMIHQVTGTMSFYIPYSMLKPVINVLNPHTIITGRKQHYMDPEARRLNEENLSQIDMDIQVVLGSNKITVKDLSALQTGDVIVLNSPTKKDLEVRISGKPRFQGKVGRVGNHLAVKITSTIQES